KVALISRGDIPFVDKIEAAREAGAVATLIHNNEGSGPADVFLGDAFTWIPSFDMATEEGEALREALGDNIGTVSFANIDSEVSDGDLLNDSSSRGPSVPNYDIKPDVVAPGTNIMATVPAYGKDYSDADYTEAYDRKTGTSMATPNVAGIVALLLSEHSDWDPYDVKVALSNTAEPLSNSYHVFEEGAGLVQPEKALNASVLAYAKDTRVVDGDEVRNDKGTITFGAVEPTDEEQEVKVEVEVKFLTGGSENFGAELQFLEKAYGTDVSLDKDSFTVSGEETLEVTLTVGTEDEVSGDETYGYLHLTSENSELSLPFAAVFDDISGGILANLYLVDPALSLSGEDGVVDYTELYFSLLEPAFYFEIALWDALNPTAGPDEDGYIGLFANGLFVDQGNYYVEMDGEYLELETEEEVMA